MKKRVPLLLLAAPVFAALAPPLIAAEASGSPASALAPAVPGAEKAAPVFGTVKCDLDKLIGLTPARRAALLEWKQLRLGEWNASVRLALAETPELRDHEMGPKNWTIDFHWHLVRKDGVVTAVTCAVLEDRAGAHPVTTLHAFNFIAGSDLPLSPRKLFAGADPLPRLRGILEQLRESPEETPALAPILGEADDETDDARPGDAPSEGDEAEVLGATLENLRVTLTEIQDILPRLDALADASDADARQRFDEFLDDPDSPPHLRAFIEVIRDNPSETLETLSRLGLVESDPEGADNPDTALESLKELFSGDGSQPVRRAAVANLRELLKEGTELLPLLDTLAAAVSGEEISLEKATNAADFIEKFLAEADNAPRLKAFLENLRDNPELVADALTRLGLAECDDEDGETPDADALRRALLENIQINLGEIAEVLARLAPTPSETGDDCEPAEDDDPEVTSENYPIEWHHLEQVAIGPDGLIFLFDQGDIAPMYYGPLTIAVPLEKLRPLLSPEALAFFNQR